MDKTLKLLTKSLQRDPEDWETRKHLLDTYLETGDVASAVNLVREAPNVPQDDADLIGVVNFLGGNDPFAALGFAERAMMTDPDRGASHLAKSLACNFIGQPDAAAEHKANALQMTPGLVALIGESQQVPAAGPVPPVPPTPEPVEVAPDTIEATAPAEAVVDEAVAEIEPVVAVEEYAAAGEPVTAEPVIEPDPVAIGGFVAASDLPPIQPLVNPLEVPEPVTIPIDDVDQAPLTFTSTEDLELTRSHLLVATPEGEFVDADEEFAIAGAEEESFDDNSLVVAPAGIAPEAAETERTKAKVSAILMTIAVHVALFALIGLIVIAAPRILPPEIVASTVPSSDSEQISKKQVVKQSPPKQVSPPAPSVSAITTMTSTSSASIPNVDFEADASLELGTDFGASMNFGSAGGDFGAGVPFTMKSRCSAAERTKLLREHGGSSKVAKAVKKSLDYLQSKQNEDGSWGDHHKAGMTAFALLSYLGHCETPDSPQYGDTVMKGIMYLVELGENNDGLFAAVQDHHYPYEHGPATYALGETYALAKFGKRQLPGVRDAFEKGVRIIIDGQNEADGGWNYGYPARDVGDTSVTGWQYQALKAAKHTNLKISGLSTAIADSEKFFTTVRDPERKGDKDQQHFYQYKRNHSLNERSNWNMTAVCALGMQLLGDHEKEEHQEEIDGAIEWLFDNAERLTQHNYAQMDPYGWYYATQVMFQKGGDTWKKWNKIFAADILDLQEPDGSWPNPRGRTKSDGDKEVYHQCLNTLMLEVYFRYLPAAG